MTKPRFSSAFPSYCDRVIRDGLPGVMAQKMMGSRPDRHPPVDELDGVDSRNSAVLVLFSLDEPHSILYTVRNEQLANHGGQISFPGGRQDPGETPLETAMREAEEEVGIRPDQYQIIGCLSPLFVPPSRFIIQPWLAFCDKRPPLTLHTREVSEAFWVDVDELMDFKKVKKRELLYLGEKLVYPYWDVHNVPLWGATAMITSEIITIYRNFLEEDHALPQQKKSRHAIPDDSESNGDSASIAPAIVTTRDGSRSMYSRHYRQHYHNIAGALTESRHVFFDNTGLSSALAGHRDVVILEVGFGTGHHIALLECLRKLTGSRSRVFYYGIEKYPVPGDLVRQMGFQMICEGMDEIAGQIADALCSVDDGDSVRFFIRDGSLGPVPGSDQNPGAAKRGEGPSGPDEYPPADDVHKRLDSGKNPSRLDEDLTADGDPIRQDSGEGPSGSKSPSDGPFTRIEVFRGDFTEMAFADAANKNIIPPVDFFLHDAFSPHVNPELWTVRTFTALMSLADKQAMLGTYCSATKARAAMILAGWHVARVVGPPGKREVTVASPDETCLRGYKRVNEKLLSDRFRDELA